jgi:hypothetical protein
MNADFVRFPELRAYRPGQTPERMTIYSATFSQAEKP